jgi:hypothetical protein
LKGAYRKILRKYVRDGHVNFSRVDFVRELGKIYNKGLSRYNLISGFERVGIYPINRELILGSFKRKRKLREEERPIVPSLIPDEDLPIIAKAALLRIKRRAELFSSPTRYALLGIERTVE